ncbi:uncharacterized protein DUF4843 [Mucilaginibacter oryzae]|uniref:Uncharacterized protein DUF4843 n=1 Tax=Mucilaginibacter oryzae TaxID=468058 RepID=A0A316HH11_9SPHI|nr:DUF4843 domain-containing protein [Mucilaginibacter oryzae]PWK80489.1 uncharacterized protein DUF4843 [Mucilaginibacter oryzae]
MKRDLLVVILVCTVIFGCKKVDKMYYSSEKDNIYMNYGNADNFGPDSLVFSFAYNPAIDKDTVWIPVIISGKTASHDRKFALNVVDANTTATRIIHYEPLKSSYIMPADSGTTHVPVIIKNIDTGLVNKSVTLTVRVSGGEDFASNLPTNIRTKRIIFSNRLEEPYWWHFWLGQYSRTKHQLFLISSGATELIDPTKPDAYLQIPRTLYYVANMREFLTYPFDWVKNNPAKGYVLAPRNDGTGDYDFYNTSSPGKKYYLKYFKSAGRYVFIDESGNQIQV